MDIPILVRAILLTLAGLGLFVFAWDVHPFAWELTLPPIWRWILCGLGLLIPGASFWWVAIEEEEWEIWFILLGVGLVVFLGGWYLEFLLWLFPYFCGGLLYLAGIILVCFGAWQAWDEWRFWKAYRIRWEAYRRQSGEEATDSWDGAYDPFDPWDDEAGSSHERQHEERADASQDEAADSSDEWARSVLGIKRGATQKEVHDAYLMKVKEYHPDKVAQLGKEIREVAERKTKDVNRAYDILKQR